ncbi:MAG: hypothetical protein RM347_018015 [Nostoc sp. ChiQUE02]
MHIYKLGTNKLYAPLRSHRTATVNSQDSCRSDFSVRLNFNPQLSTNLRNCVLSMSQLSAMWQRKIVRRRLRSDGEPAVPSPAIQPPN